MDATDPNPHRRQAAPPPTPIGETAAPLRPETRDRMRAFFASAPPTEPPGGKRAVEERRALRRLSSELR